MFHIKCLERPTGSLAWFVLALSKVSVKVVWNKGIGYSISLGPSGLPPLLISCHPAAHQEIETMLAREAPRAHLHQISGMTRRPTGENNQAGGIHSSNDFLQGCGHCSSRAAVLGCLPDTGARNSYNGK